MEVDVVKHGGLENQQDMIRFLIFLADWLDCLVGPDVVVKVAADPCNSGEPHLDSGRLGQIIRPTWEPVAGLVGLLMGCPE